MEDKLYASYSCRLLVMRFLRTFQRWLELELELEPKQSSGVAEHARDRSKLHIWTLSNAVRNLAEMHSVFNLCCYYCCYLLLIDLWNCNQRNVLKAARRGSTFCVRDRISDCRALPKLLLNGCCLLFFSVVRFSPTYNNRQWEISAELVFSFH